jgi:hypothetical protein
MKHARPLFAVLAGSLAVGIISAQGDTSVGGYLYDDFSAAFIDSAKWEGTGGWSRNTTEFVRQIRNGHLRLGARTYGNRWADTGSEFDIAELELKNAATITSLGSWVVVKNIGSRSCANNPWTSDPEVQLIGGGFFTIGDDPNSGTGNVDALMTIQPGASGGPLIVRMIVGVVGGSDLGEANLGTVAIGEPVFLFVRWDQTNHRFLGGMRKNGTPLATAVIPYAVDDSRAAGYTYRGLSVRNNTANCVATPTFSGAEAEFDRVMVDVPWGS